ncbi:MAG: AMP-binding protein, partial [Phormidesmis sp.]
MKPNSSMPLPTAFTTLNQVLTDWARQQPDCKAYTVLDSKGAEDDCITYRELHARATSVARHLISLGLHTRTALLVYPSGIEFIVAFFGCLYAGVLPAPVHTPKRNRSNQRIAELALSAEAVAVLLPASHKQTYQDLLSREASWPKALKWIATNVISTTIPSPVAPLPEITGNSIAFLQFTSGSTSLPRGVMISHAACLQNLAMSVAVSKAEPVSTFVSWLPHYHDLGLVAHILHSLYSGAHCVLLAPASFISKPVQWLRAITNYRAQYSGAPNFAYQLCVDRVSPQEHQGLDLSTLKMVINAAEPIIPRTLVDFSQTFADQGFEPRMFLPAYGMAEATVFISSGEVEREPVFKTIDWMMLGQEGIAKAATNNERSKVFVGCGHTWLDQQIRIMNSDDSSPQPTNHIGEIWITGSNVMSGYYNNPAATDKALVRLPEDEHLYFRTGDLGFIDENNELYITGRLKDLIIINGVNYYPQDIESCVEQAHLDIRFGCVSAFSVSEKAAEELVVFLELKRATASKVQQSEYFSQLVESICIALGDRFEIPLQRLVFLKPMQLPKTSSGKIRRQQCKQDYLQGMTDAIAQWPEVKPNVVNQGDSDMKTKARTSNIDKTLNRITSMGPVHLKVFTNLMQILTAHYQIQMSDFDVEKSIFFYGIDSLKVIEIHSLLEEKMSCEIPTEAFFYSNTFLGMVDDIVQAISTEEGAPVRFTHSQPLDKEINDASDYLLKDRDLSLARLTVGADKRHESNMTFLTGASGFVGTYFLGELLNTTNLDVACMVRAEDSEAGLVRIRTTAKKFNVALPAEWESRVEIVIGDMSKRKFGLSDQAYEAYAQKLDSVYHVAAVDNFYLPYDIIKKTNVVGTIEVADFALSGKVKPLYNVSSCAAALLEGNESSPTIAGLVNGYAQTKYVTEQIVVRLAEKGLPWV